MRRPLIAAVLVLLGTGVAPVGNATQRQAINLNEPGAIEALQRSNPTHYEKVRRILEGVLYQPDAVVPRWMQANFDAREVKYVPIVLTSHPPKRRISFSLDATRYEAVVVLTNVRGEIIPAK
jgi:hypothetical protein